MFLHTRPEATLKRYWALIPNRAANSRVGTFLYSARISRTWPAVRCALALRSPSRGGAAPVRYQWAMFSDAVTHSRFSGRLFSLSPSIWLTACVGVGGEPRNASATRRWTTRVVRGPFSRPIMTLRYPIHPRPFDDAPPRTRSTSTLPESLRRILPKELASYNDSDGMGFHVSMSDMNSSYCVGC